jgi:predicted RNA-binding protein YlqC (UPF0109 family)
MKKLISYLITSIVDQPDKFCLKEETTDSGYTNYLIKVAPEDMGKVIGKRGQIIQALRTIIRAKAFKEGQKVILTLEE